MKRVVWPLLALIILLAFWEVGSRVSSHVLLVLPAPTEIAGQLWDNAGRFLFHTHHTLKVMLGGFFLAFILAFPLAWIMSLKKGASLVLQPLFILTQCVPMFALAPIMVIWFGWTYTAIVVPTALMIFFPLTMNIYQGLTSTPSHLVDYFKSHQATNWQLFYKLQLPWSLPYLFAGCRIAAAIAGIGAIAGEWAGAQNGLGMLMLESRRSADLPTTFGALFCLTAVSLCLYGMITLFEKKILSRKFVHLAINRTLSCLLMVAGLCLNSCSTDQNTEKETRLILDWLPNANHVPLYAGIKKGFFQKQKINLKIYKIHDPADPIPYLTSGQAELAVSYQPSIVRANQRGANVQPVAVLIPVPLNALIYRQDAGITTKEDLNGKIFGYSIDGTGTACLDYILKKNGIAPLQKRNVSFDLVSTIGSKQVDVIYGAYWNIECAQLQSLGIETSHMALTELGFPSYRELVLIAREDSPQATQEFVSGLKQAMQESVDYCKANPDEAFTIYAEANPDKSTKTLAWEKNAWQLTLPLLPSNQEIDPTDWNNFSEWLGTVIK